MVTRRSGLFIDGEHVKEGEWKQVGTAQVSSGGDRIETEFKLPCLAWIDYERIIE